MEKTSQSRAIAKCQSELSGEAVEEPRDPRTVRIGGGAENPIVELGQEEGWETAKRGATMGEATAWDPSAKCRGQDGRQAVLVYVGARGFSALGHTA